MMGTSLWAHRYSKIPKFKIQNTKYLGEGRKKVRAEQSGLVLAFVWTAKKTWGIFIQSRVLIL